MPSEPNQHHHKHLQWYAVTWEGRTLLPLHPLVNQPNYPDQQTGDAAEDQMQEKGALQPLPLKLPLPGEETGDHDGHGREGGREEIPVSGHSQLALLSRLGEKIKRDAGDEQRNRKMNQYYSCACFASRTVRKSKGFTIVPLIHSA